MSNTLENEFIVNILDLKHERSLLACWVMTTSEIEKFNNDNRGFLIAVVANQATPQNNRRYELW